MSCAFDRDIVDKAAEADLAKEVAVSTDDDDLARETEHYLAFECGNCHNILRIMPKEAANQVSDGEGWVPCNCGAPFIGKYHRGMWTP